MFQGFSDETFEFFMAIRFNNNADFFHANHDWYQRAVREPCIALAEALSPAIEALDEDLDRRPNRVVSRINRDIRFSRDKSPYRDYIWLSWKAPSEQRDTALGVYFEISADSAEYGMGIYNENRPLMNGLRRQMLVDPQKVEELFLARQEFSLHVNCFRRMKMPDALPETLRALYPIRSFYFEKTLTDFDLVKSPALADEIAGGLNRLSPLYRYLCDIQPIENVPL